MSIIQAAGWPIWPLIACSVLALALILERFAALRTARVAPAKLLDEAITVSSSTVPGPDVVGQLAQNSALGEVLASGLRALQQNPKCSEADLRASMEGAGRSVAHRLEKYLSALATIASAAPLLGLLGTVLGIIEVFQGLAAHADASAGTLAGGIWEALLTTAVGLCVAVPFAIVHAALENRIERFRARLEDALTRLFTVTLYR